MELKIVDIKGPKNLLFENLNSSQLQEIKSLYKNGYICDVKLVKYKQKQYALKIIQKSRIPVDIYQSQYRRIYNQITILYILNHPNIIKLYWHCETKDSILLLFQCFGVKLWKVLKNRVLNQNQIKIIFKQICLALQQMHQNGFIHRDVSSDNILINQKLQCKLIDFGYANELVGERFTVLGSLQYIAPQIVKNMPYNHKADIWSLGILLYQLFHKKTPFSAGNDLDPNQIQKNRSNLNYTFDKNVPEKVQQIIKNILVHNPQKRPNASQILLYPWFRNTNDDLEQFRKRQTHRKTQKFQLNVNINKDMSIKQLQNMLINLSNIHSKQLIRKKQLLTEIFQIELQLLKKKQQRIQKTIK